ncbi:hypothetical protein F4778DRAFT_775888 [Xylariomycetidae sp. FL2044]|nr:hypothetical protein F4778DRAFT_775888 [Xylariomycetidae sp. FL2044]
MAYRQTTPVRVQPDRAVKLKRPPPERGGFSLFGQLPMELQLIVVHAFHKQKGKPTHAAFHGTKLVTFDFTELMALSRYRGSRFKHLCFSADDNVHRILKTRSNRPTARPVRAIWADTSRDMFFFLGERSSPLAKKYANWYQRVAVSRNRFDRSLSFIDNKELTIVPPKPTPASNLLPEDEFGRYFEYQRKKGGRDGDFHQRRRSQPLSFQVYTPRTVKVSLSPIWVDIVKELGLAKEWNTHGWA